MEAAFKELSANNLDSACLYRRMSSGLYLDNLVSFVIAFNSFKYFSSSNF
jgi:hypothetical protein